MDISVVFYVKYEYNRASLSTYWLFIVRTQCVPRILKASGIVKIKWIIFKVKIKQTDSSLFSSVKIFLIFHVFTVRSFRFHAGTTRWRDFFSVQQTWEAVTIQSSCRDRYLLALVFYMFASSDGIILILASSFISYFLMNIQKNIYVQPRSEEQTTIKQLSAWSSHLAHL